MSSLDSKNSKRPWKVFLEKKIQDLRTDNKGEFTSDEFSSFC